MGAGLEGLWVGAGGRETSKIIGVVCGLFQNADVFPGTSIPLLEPHHLTRTGKPNPHATREGFGASTQTQGATGGAGTDLHEASSPQHTP